MAGNGRDRYAAVPKTLNAKTHGREFNATVIAVYYVLACHAGTEEGKKNFSRAWPSVDTIAGLTNLGRGRVFKALRWLVENSYLYRDRMKGGPSVFTLVLHRKEFEEWSATRGRAQAIGHYESWLAKCGDAKSAPDNGSHPEVSPVTLHTRESIGAKPTNVPPGTSPVSGVTSVPGDTQNDLDLGGRTTFKERESAAAASDPPVFEHHQDDSKSNGKDNSNPDPDRLEIKEMAATLGQHLKLITAGGSK